MAPECFALFVHVSAVSTYWDVWSSPKEDTKSRNPLIVFYSNRFILRRLVAVAGDVSIDSKLLAELFQN